MISNKQPAADLLYYTPPPTPNYQNSERRPGGDWDEEMSTGVCVPDSRTLFFSFCLLTIANTQMMTTTRTETTPTNTAGVMAGLVPT